jgi:hypothetical protein
MLAVVVGRNCAQWVNRCLESLHKQYDVPLEVFVVDDASDDGQTPSAVAGLCEDYGFGYQLNHDRLGAMANQWHAWHAMGPEGDDIVVWVDLDDRLNSRHALSIVRSCYLRGALVTYGSYLTDPFDEKCPAVRLYPEDAYDDLRGFVRRHGFWFNHLRTVSWKILRHLDELDCRDNDGEWWTTGCDAAVMLPALEMAGPNRVAMIQDPLYVRQSDERLAPVARRSPPEPPGDPRPPSESEAAVIGDATREAAKEARQMVRRAREIEDARNLRDKPKPKRRGPYSREPFTRPLEDPARALGHPPRPRKRTR